MNSAPDWQLGANSLLLQDRLYILLPVLISRLRVLTPGSGLTMNSLRKNRRGRETGERGRMRRKRVSHLKWATDYIFYRLWKVSISSEQKPHKLGKHSAAGLCPNLLFTFYFETRSKLSRLTDPELTL